MKKQIILLQMILLGFGLHAQETNPGDTILGTYASVQSGYEYHAKVTKKEDGTYKAQVVWVKDAVDPDRGIRANVVVRFTSDGRLSLKGSLLGISETVYWTRL